MEFRTTDTTIRDQDIKALEAYTEYIEATISGETTNPERALIAGNEAEGHALAVATKFPHLRHVILVGIGGSSLGAEAVHAALADITSPTLTVLDAVSESAIAALLGRLTLEQITLKDIAVVIISKSGSTTETVVNASLLLEALTAHFGSNTMSRVICVSEEGSKLAQVLDRASTFVPMPKEIGGRYSVFTTVGLVPLALLGHDIAQISAGARDVVASDFDRSLPTAFLSASHLAHAGEHNVTTYDTFLFDTRLRAYGLWRRQLMGESLGKSVSRSGAVGVYGPLPTVSTLVDLHSVGQLYLGGFRGIHTDFVSLTDYGTGIIPDSRTASVLPDIVGRTSTEITNAIYHGVTASYHDLHLPYHEYILRCISSYELGSLMAFNMLETMLAAELMDLNAFDQPNVELYKTKTREALAS